MADDVPWGLLTLGMTVYYVLIGIAIGVLL
jgi:hypothetical protein